MPCLQLALSSSADSPLPSGAEKEIIGEIGLRARRICRDRRIGCRTISAWPTRRASSALSAPESRRRAQPWSLAPRPPSSGRQGAGGLGRAEPAGPRGLVEGQQEGLLGLQPRCGEGRSTCSTVCVSSAARLGRRLRICAWNGIFMKSPITGSPSSFGSSIDSYNCHHYCTVSSSGKNLTRCIGNVTLPFRAGSTGLRPLQIKRNIRCGIAFSAR